MLDVNFHTHSFYCGHGRGTIDEYCIAANAQQLKVLGFSEHGPFPDEGYRNSRMPYTDLKLYCADIANARSTHPELDIYAGLEADYRKEYGKAFFEDVYFGQYRLDYLIGGTHWYERPDGSLMGPFGGDRLEINDVRNFARRGIKLMETGLLLYFAHPDVMAMAFTEWTSEHDAIFQDLIDAAAALKVPLEINVSGMRRPLVTLADGSSRYCYPVARFWELAAASGIEAVIGADAHRPELLTDRFDLGLDWAAKFGLPVVNHKLATKLAARRRIDDAAKRTI